MYIIVSQKTLNIKGYDKIWLQIRIRHIITWYILLNNIIKLITLLYLYKKYRD